MATIAPIPLSSGHEAEDEAETLLRPVSRNRQLQVLISGFLTIAMTIGLNQAYGVFQSYYISPSQTMLSHSGKNVASIAFIGTLGYGLTWAGGIVVNPIISRLDAHGNRMLSVLGVLGMASGMAGASFGSQIWHLLLTQGLLYGIGSSLFYFPLLSAAPEYFNSRRGAAMGLILSGAGAGGLVFSPTVRWLLTAIGPRWTLRTLALIILIVALPIAFTAPPSRFVTRRDTHVSLSLARKPAFLLSVGAAFLQAGGNGLPLAFLPEYSVVVGYSPAFGATLLAVSNAVNSLSRVIMGGVGDRWGRQNVLICTLGFTVLAVVGGWLGSTFLGIGGGKGLWVVFVVLYGIAGGGYNALFPTTIADVFGIHAYASVNGFMYFMRGVGTMFGSPVGGRILGESTIVGYRGLIAFDAALLGGAALCVVGVRWWDAVEKGEWRSRA